MAYWRMVIEDFGAELIYIKGHNNIAADAMSRLDTTATGLNALEKYLNLNIVAKGLAKLDTKVSRLMHKKDPNLYTIADYYGSEQLPEDIYSVQFKLLQTEQQKDEKLIEKAKTYKAEYNVKDFLGGGKKHQLICSKDKIVASTRLQDKIVEWYHKRLCHLGLTRTKVTIR
eukprot:6670966-Ditylum_brightwellii.AAC.1